MVSTRSSPSTHSIPALPPKRRLSLTPLSPNIPPESAHTLHKNAIMTAQETNTSAITNDSHRCITHSTPNSATITNHRPPRNPSESSVGVKRSTSKREDKMTPLKSNVADHKKTKIHHFENDDVLTIPDPPTPDETTNSIRIAAAKLLESRARRRRSLPILQPCERDWTETPLKQSPLQISTPSTTAQDTPSFAKDSPRKGDHDLFTPQSHSICFDDDTENDPMEHGAATAQTSPSKMDPVKGRRSILLPSDAGQDHKFGFKSDDGWVSGSSDPTVHNGLELNNIPSESMLKPKQSSTSSLWTQDANTNSLHEEKVECMKRAVRKLCKLPWENRYLSPEASFIEELSGYPILNPMDKLRQANHHTIKGNQSESSTVMENHAIDSFTGPTDQMKIQLINQLAPYIEYLEDKRNKETSALENATGYRVMKGRNGRFTYNHIKNGESVTAKEYERAYRSVSLTMKTVTNKSPQATIPLKSSDDGRSRLPSSSENIHENTMIAELRSALEKFRCPTSGDPMIVAAQRRLVAEIDVSIKNYQQILNGSL